jgi:hypothetical protein
VAVACGVFAGAAPACGSVSAARGIAQRSAKTINLTVTAFFIFLPDAFYDFYMQSFA